MRVDDKDSPYIVFKRSWGITLPSVLPGPRPGFVPTLRVCHQSAARPCGLILGTNSIRYFPCPDRVNGCLDVKRTLQCTVGEL